MHSKKPISVALLIVLGLAAFLGLYYQFVYKPRKEAEEARRPYRKLVLAMSRLRAF